MNLSIRTLLPGGVAVALLAFTGAAHAQNDRGFYIGAGVGSTTFETLQVTASIPPLRVKVKDSSTSTRVFGGYRAARWIAIEAGSTAFGELQDSVRDAVDDLQIYQATYGGYDVSLIANLPLADDAFGLFARIGVARSTYDEALFDSVDPSFGQDNRQKTTQKSSIFGVGAQFNFGSDKNMGIRIEYDIYDVNLLAEDQKSVMASFVYRF